MDQEYFKVQKLIGQQGVGLPENGEMISVWSHGNGIHMHGLIILPMIALRQNGIQSAHFRGENIFSNDTADHAGAKFFSILGHEDHIVGKTPHDAIGSVDNQVAAGLLEVDQKTAVRMGFDLILI